MSSGRSGFVIITLVGEEGFTAIRWLNGYLDTVLSPLTRKRNLRSPPSSAKLSSGVLSLLAELSHFTTSVTESPLHRNNEKFSCACRLPYGLRFHCTSSRDHLWCRDCSASRRQDIQRQTSHQPDRPREASMSQFRRLLP